MNNSRNLNFEPGGVSPNFKLMKRVFAGIMLGSFLALGPARAADAVTLAAQQEAEERAKRLSATIEEIQAAQLTQQKQISALANELSKLREEVARTVVQPDEVADELRYLIDVVCRWGGMG